MSTEDVGSDSGVGTQREILVDRFGDGTAVYWSRLNDRIKHRAVRVETEGGILCPVCHLNPDSVSYNSTRYKSGRYKNLRSHWTHQHTNVEFPSELPHVGKTTSEKISKATSEAQMGRGLSEEHRKAISEGHKGTPLSEEHRRAISETLTGREMSDESRKNLSDALSGVPKTQEHRDAIAEGNTGKKFSKERIAAIQENISPPTSEYVAEIGQKVRNGWEADIVRLLCDNGFEPEYEPEAFDLGDRLYIPDIRVGDIVIEIKGRSYGNCYAKAEKFMRRYRTYTYIVIGKHPWIPCHYHFLWKNRKDVLGALRDREKAPSPTRQF